MGQKYYIEAKLSGYCGIAQESKSTKHFVIALITVIKYRLKYPIVNFYIRNGYKDCDKCNEGGKLLCNPGLPKIYNK